MVQENWPRNSEASGFNSLGGIALSHCDLFARGPLSAVDQRIPEANKTGYSDRNQGFAPRDLTRRRNVTRLSWALKLILGMVFLVRWVLGLGGLKNPKAGVPEAKESPETDGAHVTIGQYKHGDRQ